MQESKMLDVRTILVSIRQYLSNELDGFRATLNEINTHAEKQNFLAACKKVVEQGWQEEFNHIEGLLLFKPYLVDPCAALNLSPSSGVAAKYFTRLCLLKLMAEASIEDNTLIDDTRRFRSARDTLSAEFIKISQESNTTFIYHGKEIKNLDDLREVREQAQRQIDGRVVFKLALLLAMAASLGSSIMRKKNISMPVNVQIGVSATISLFMLYFLVTRAFPAIAGYRGMLFANNAQRELQRQPVQANIMADNNIQKFFLLNDEDLKKLEENPNLNRSALALSPIIK